MSRIPMTTRGRRLRFFEANGTDELLSMVLELSAELWTVKERLYLLERAAGNGSGPLNERIETYVPTPPEQAELEEERRRMIGTILRSLETRDVTTPDAGAPGVDGSRTAPFIALVS